jgi:hypothetical protein
MQKEAKYGKWIYYVNDEGKARWKCSLCGKIATVILRTSCIAAGAAAGT